MVKDEEESEGSDSGDEDENMALITQRFRKFIRRKRQNFIKSYL